MKTEIEVPESTSEIPLKRYAEMMQMPNEDYNDFVKVFQVVTGCSKEVAKGVRAIDVERSMKAIVSALNDTDVPLIKKVEHNGVRYGLEPKLDDITIGMAADLETMLNEPEMWNQAMAILYRPITRETKAMGGLYAIEKYKYDTPEFRERAEAFETLPASVFLGVRAFFLNGMMDFERYIWDSLPPEAQKEHRKRSSEVG